MLERAIPSTGEMLPVIGFGTWQTFDIGADTAARAERRRVLETLFASGGRLIDSSPMYGRAEGVVGDVLETMGGHPKAFLATKVWTTGRDEGIRQMAASARLMKTAVIDLMQIHNLVDWRTHLATLRAMKAEGQIRYIGVTHYTVAALHDLVAVVKSEPIDFVQTVYSLDVREAEKTLLPLAADKGVAVIANKPFAAGSMFQKVKGLALPEWTGQLGCRSWAEVFLKYALHPAVTCVIPATSRPAHAAEMVAAGSGVIPDAAQRALIARYWDRL